jgi:hypothetical protein
VGFPPSSLAFSEYDRRARDRPSTRPRDVVTTPHRSSFRYDCGAGRPVRVRRSAGLWRTGSASDFRSPHLIP